MTKAYHKITSNPLFIPEYIRKHPFEKCSIKFMGAIGHKTILIKILWWDLTAIVFKVISLVETKWKHLPCTPTVYNTCKENLLFIVCNVGT